MGNSTGKELIEAVGDNKLQDIISLLSKGANINSQDDVS